jgi:hypothetical protein
MATRKLKRVALLDSEYTLATHKNTNINICFVALEGFAVLKEMQPH